MAPRDEGLSRAPEPWGVGNAPVFNIDCWACLLEFAYHRDNWLVAAKRS